ncbi:MAG: FAD-dependent oxidoreductase [Rhodospirillales bacterium]|nr:FAD-dependent oxidoreductase [Rhodospirillales bacterium]QQS15162.1 MAG: FAD-dependent oxidoreductase [Rhodospirillales bacterium]
MHVIVVGAGISGLSTAWALAKGGHRVTLIERDAIPNPLGASGDQHRIIRRAYTMAGYTRRMTEGFAAWDELWADLGREHVARVGFMGISLEEGDRADEYREGLARDGFPFTLYPRDEAIRRYPFLNPERVRNAFVSPEGGVLLCLPIAAGMLAWLRGKGVEVRDHAVVERVDTAAARVTLAGGATLTADAVVVTAGAWATALLPEMARPLASRRTYVVYLDPPADLREAWSRAPSIPGIGADVEGYVLPPVAGTDLKFGAGRTRLPWTPGEPVDLAADAGAELRDVFGPAFARIGDYAVKGVRACVYTFTEDDRFYAARSGATWLVSACSGHGYKFGAAVGRRVAAAVAGGDEASLVEWLAARD